MNHDRQKTVLAGYADSGYVLGNSSYTCCRNCARQNNCPMERTGKMCPEDNHSCHPCTRWDRQGCRYFVLDWNVLATR